MTLAPRTIIRCMCNRYWRSSGSFVPASAATWMHDCGSAGSNSKLTRAHKQRTQAVMIYSLVGAFHTALPLPWACQKVPKPYLACSPRQAQHQMKEEILRNAHLRRQRAPAARLPPGDQHVAPHFVAVQQSNPRRQAAHPAGSSESTWEAALHVGGQSLCSAPAAAGGAPRRRGSRRAG